MLVTPKSSLQGSESRELLFDGMLDESLLSEALDVK